MKLDNTRHLLAITIGCIVYLLPACDRKQNALDHNQLGVAYWTQGKLEQAIAQYQKAIQIDPNFAQAHYNLGNVYKNQGQLEQAIVEYQKVIQIDPNLAYAHYDLGVVYVKQGQLDQAIAEYQKTIQIDPNFAFAYPYYGLAAIYSLKNETALAIEWLQKAISMDARWIELSKAESAFDNIRQSPEFQQLINSQ